MCFSHSRSVFAQQGYFTVLINPTGSTTFGQGNQAILYTQPLCIHMHFIEFTDAIAEDWGGKPFVDMIAGWKYVLDSYPQARHIRLIDPRNAKLL